ncbi:MAG: hypothetical protein QHI48_00695 [Bacteroidota bacterium]|nr:hypothetical protein [Bacteroidota bacterium]
MNQPPISSHPSRIFPRTVQSAVRRSLLFAPLFMVLSCSAPKEEVEPLKVEPIAEPLKPPEPVREFQFEERYLVRHASIDTSTRVEDPLQAVRVVQLKPGANTVLVISSFDKSSNTKRAAVETWFAIELPSFEPGTYDLTDAKRLVFHRFFLGEKSERADGESFKGRLIIEGMEGGAIVGSVDATVSGTTKSFELPSRPFTTRFTGSFRIKEVPFEATILKGR